MEMRHGSVNLRAGLGVWPCTPTEAHVLLVQDLAQERLNTGEWPEMPAGLKRNRCRAWELASVDAAYVDGLRRDRMEEWEEAQIRRLDTMAGIMGDLWSVEMMLVELAALIRESEDDEHVVVAAVSWMHSPDHPPVGVQVSRALRHPRWVGGCRLWPSARGTHAAVLGSWKNPVGPAGVILADPVAAHVHVPHRRGWRPLRCAELAAEIPAVLKYHGAVSAAWVPPEEDIRTVLGLVTKEEADHLGI